MFRGKEVSLATLEKPYIAASLSIDAMASYCASVFFVERSIDHSFSLLLLLPHFPCSNRCFVVIMSVTTCIVVVDVVSAVEFVVDMFSAKHARSLTTFHLEISFSTFNEST